MLIVCVCGVVQMQLGLLKLFFFGKTTIYTNMYKGWCERNDSIFFFQKVSIITVTMKLTYMMDISFTHFRLFFHKVSLIINTLFTTFCETLYARHVKFFVEASELFMYTVSACHPQNGILRFHSSGGQKDGSHRVLNQDCRADEELIHLPLWLNPSN